MGYPGLLKLYYLDLVTICITHARQIKSDKLTKWFDSNISTVHC